MGGVEPGATVQAYAENTTGATRSMILKSAFPRGLKPDASSRLLRGGTQRVPRHALSKPAYTSPFKAALHQREKWPITDRVAH
jgi:hypothetical protein